MVRLFFLLAVLSSLVVVSGCRSMWPSVFNPGSTEMQRANASRHDPYTDDDLGPNVDGGRPRDFQKPRAEPVRDQPFSNVRTFPY